MRSTEVLYEHLPGEEENPLMESTLHVKWGHLLLGAVGHVLAGTDALVTGNVRWDPDDGHARVAPDLMVIPGWAGRDFGAFEPGETGPTPSVCVEILSPSNRGPKFEARLHRMLALGVPEVYVVDPIGNKVSRAAHDPHGALVHHDALGVASAGLGITFGLTGTGLVVCCPAGRVVSPGDDPYGWIVEAETRARAAEERASTAEERASSAEERASTAERQLAAVRKRAAAAGLDLHEER